MEKIIIVSCSDTGKTSTKTGGKIYAVEIKDGRKCMSFVDLSEKVGQEIEAQMKQTTIYQGVQQFCIIPPHVGGARGVTKTRNQALMCACTLLSNNKTSSSADAISVAEEFLQWLKKA